MWLRATALSHTTTYVSEKVISPLNALYNLSSIWRNAYGNVPTNSMYNHNHEWKERSYKNLQKKCVQFIYTSNRPLSTLHSMPYRTHALRRVCIVSIAQNTAQPAIYLMPHPGTTQLQLDYLDGLMQDCSIFSALAMEILQPCTKLSTFKSPAYCKPIPWQKILRPLFTEH